MKFKFSTIAALTLVMLPLNIYAAPDVFFSQNLEETILNIPHRKTTDVQHQFEPHFPTFYLGVNLLCDQNSLNSTAEIAIRKGKGLELGMYFLEEGYSFNYNNTIGVSVGMGISRSRYWLKDGRYLDWRTNTKTNRSELIITTSNDVEQGYLRYWSLRVPICLEFQSAKNDGFFISAGPELEYRFGNKSIVKDMDGDHHKITNDLNINPIGLNVLFQAGVNNLGIMFRYSLLELFDTSKPVETYPLMIGCSLCF